MAVLQSLVFPRGYPWRFRLLDPFVGSCAPSPPLVQSVTAQPCETQADSPDYIHGIYLWDSCQQLRTAEDLAHMTLEANLQNCFFTMPK